MSEPLLGSTQRTVLALSAVAWLAACGAPQRPHRAMENPDTIEDNRLLAPPGPTYPAAAGKRALLRWASECRDAGARHHPVFRKAGTLVIAWAADRDGDLLRLEFPQNSFRGWEVEVGVTFADCVVHRARAGKLRWSREGIAPLRLHAVEGPASVPASGPQSQPAPGATSRPAVHAKEAL